MTTRLENSDSYEVKSWDGILKGIKGLWKNPSDFAPVDGIMLHPGNNLKFDPGNRAIIVEQTGKIIANLKAEIKPKDPEKKNTLTTKKEITVAAGDSISKIFNNEFGKGNFNLGDKGGLRKMYETNQNWDRIDPDDKLILETDSKANENGMYLYALSREKNGKKEFITFVSSKAPLRQSREKIQELIPTTNRNAIEEYLPGLNTEEKKELFTNGSVKKNASWKEVTYSVTHGRVTHSIDTRHIDTTDVTTLITTANSKSYSQIFKDGKMISDDSPKR